MLDTGDIMAENTLECNIEGDWDVSKERFVTFTLRNQEQGGPKQ